MTVTLTREECTSLIICVRETMLAIEQQDPNGPRHPLAPLHQEFGKLKELLMTAKYRYEEG
jgi:hypothetical protein